MTKVLRFLAYRQIFPQAMPVAIGIQIKIQLLKKFRNWVSVFARVLSVRSLRRSKIAGIDRIDSRPHFFNLVRLGS